MCITHDHLFSIDFVYLISKQNVEPGSMLFRHSYNLFIHSLQPVGFGLAAHAAIMVDNATMLAIGGISGGHVISAQVLSYKVLNDSWEV